MILKIQKTRKIICRDLKLAESFKDRFFGLLIKSNPANLLFKTRFGIHTFFLTEPIDVLVLNNVFKIIQTERSLKPNRFFFWNPKYSILIELKKGTIDKFRIKQGFVLRLFN